MTESSRSDSERLRLMATLVHRLNVDWDREAANCGDSKCEGDCQTVRALLALKNEVLELELDEQ